MPHASNFQLLGFDSVLSLCPPVGYVFCFLHRLPEQHRCVYDHKEGGRQEALKTMVPASKKKFGRSFHRMDSRPGQ